MKSDLLTAMYLAIEEVKPSNGYHFHNGWLMYPEWWEESTESWKQGFEARKKYMEGTDGKEN